MTQAIEHDNAHRTYTIVHGGETHEGVRFDDVPSVLQALVDKHGAPPPPQVTETTPRRPAAPLASPPPPVVLAAAPAPADSPAALVERGEGHVDAAGRARSEADLAAARTAGFAPAQTLYARGTRVIDVGVENARMQRLAYEQKPLIGEAIGDLRQRIADEHRSDVMVPRASVYMNSNGTLVIGPDKRKLDVEPDAFRQMCRRMHLPAGAGQYLAECWPELRARNINNWTQATKEAEAVEYAEAQAVDRKYEPDTVVFRTRRNTGEGTQDVAFACVSEEYAEFDADKFASAIEQAMPEDARCSVQYDGRRAKIEVLFHSTVKPEDYVCGEFFRAAFIARTDDTGRGGLRGWSAVEQNLCLNLIITSRNAQPVFQVSHRYDTETLAKKIREGLKKAEESLAHFLRAWGYARKDDLVAQAKARGELYEGMKMSEIFAALANGTIERELVPVRGRRDVVVPQLLQSWQMDRSGDGPSAGTVTRAGLVNAFTRWAHEHDDNPWHTDKVEQGAARLLWAANDRQTAPVVVPAIPLGA